MKLSIERKAFLKAVEDGGRAAGKTTLPITLCVKIKLSEGKLKVSSTNNKTFVSKQIEIDYKGEPAEFGVEANMLITTLKSIKDPMVELSLENKQLIVAHSKGELQLPTLSASTFPLPRIEGEARQIVVDAEFFTSSLIRASKFVYVDKSNDKPALQCVYCYLSGDNLCVAASDSFIIFKDSVVYTGDKSDFPANGILIPSDAVPAIVNAVQKEGDIVIKDRERNFSINSNGCSIFVTKGEGRYPNLERIFQLPESHATVKVSEVMDSVKRCALAASTDMAMYLDCEHDKVKIEAADVISNKKAKDSFTCSEGLDGKSITLSATRLSAILTALPSDDAELYIKDRHSIAALCPVDFSDMRFMIAPLMTTQA